MYYILLTSGGTEIDKMGPYPTFHLRNIAAKDMWEKTCNQVEENLFWLDVVDGEVSVGAFTDLEGE